MSLLLFSRLLPGLGVAAAAFSQIAPMEDAALKYGLGVDSECGDKGRQECSTSALQRKAVELSEDVLQTKVVSHLKDCNAMNHPTEARIYPEAPDLVYVTKRGWVGCTPQLCPQGGEQGSSVAAGLAVVNVSDPRAPAIVHLWHSSEAVEGQDRLGDLLVVASLAKGGVYTFDVQQSSHPRLLAFADIPDAPSTLHVKLQKAKGKIYAFLSQGWCDDPQLMGCDRYGFSRVHSVDVTDPAMPMPVGTVHTGVHAPESITVNGNFLYVGGIESQTFAVVNITDASRMHVVCHANECATMTASYYNQMVGDYLHTGSDGSFNAAHGDTPALWVAALWGHPGGVAVFNVSQPAFPKQVGLLLHKKMSRANRIHIHYGKAVVPLEQDPAGGFAVVDVANPLMPRLLGTMFLPSQDTRVYALVVKDNIVVLFVARTCEMYAIETQGLGQ
ncbi:unnamed protein product [Symbiodinium natans]|uniref:Uncharacterized protein n=1 Tax=Symbiodinium natans TaxID=878477 RepID=A0A812MAZ7_9DINO|nr:unnamed protein product [Symbiodinium natans]